MLTSEIVTCELLSNPLALDSGNVHGAELLILIHIYKTLMAEFSMTDCQLLLLPAVLLLRLVHTV